MQVNINKKKQEAFQILKPELEVDPEKNPYYDPGMGIDKNKILRPKKMTFQFVEEGKWSRDAEIIKLKVFNFSLLWLLLLLGYVPSSGPTQDASCSGLCPLLWLLLLFFVFFSTPSLFLLLPILV